MCCDELGVGFPAQWDNSFFEWGIFGNVGESKKTPFFLKFFFTMVY